MAAQLPLFIITPHLSHKAAGFRFPLPMMNIVNGGQHARLNAVHPGFMVVPNGKTMADRVWRGVEVFQSLKKILAGEVSTLVGDEGGFAPRKTMKTPCNTLSRRSRRLIGAR